MKTLIEDFPTQLERAKAIAEKIKLTPFGKINWTMISGMGGSGIGADIFSEVCLSGFVPVHKGRKNFTMDSTIATVLCSYSGNTEETLSTLYKAHKEGAKIVCITSGGEMEKFCKKNNIDCVMIPSGMPPRTAIGYMIVQLIYIFDFFYADRKDYKKILDSSIKLISKKNIQEEIKCCAKKIAEVIVSNKSIPVIYAPIGFEGVAKRFCQQMNENAKMLAWHNVIPEMNHNEIVGWTKDSPNIFPIFIESSLHEDKIILRTKITEKIISQYSGVYGTLNPKGKSLLEQTFYLIHQVDWISYYVAELKGVDPTEVKVIDELKEALK